MRAQLMPVLLEGPLEGEKPRAGKRDQNKGKRSEGKIRRGGGDYSALRARVG